VIHWFLAAASTTLLGLEWRRTRRDIARGDAPTAALSAAMVTVFGLMALVEVLAALHR
jgi:hypothetical protein